MFEVSTGLYQSLLQLSLVMFVNALLLLAVPNLVG